MTIRQPLLKQPLPELPLENLLKRRKTTLAAFIEVNHITTYEELCTKCDRLGVLVPAKEKYASLFPEPPVRSVPTEGIVVVEFEPMPVVSERTGRKKSKEVEVKNEEA
jgi:hypothetical protein